MAYQIIKPSFTMEQIQTVLKNGGNIKFQAGTYKITKTLYIYSNTNIIANGATFRMSACIHNIFMTYTLPSTTKYNGCKNITFTGGKIEGMKVYNTKLNLLTLWHCLDVTIKNVELCDVVGFHSVEINGCKNVTIDSCLFDGYTAIDSKTFREMIQLDYSSESAIYLHASKSACYDGTHNTNIVIKNCTFKRSANRYSYYTAIGNHSQGYNGFHNGLTISNCTFIGLDNSTTPCIRLVAWKNVTIENCNATNNGRFIEIRNYSYSYNKYNSKVTPLATDGMCYNVTIKNNTCSASKNTLKCCGVYAHVVNTTKNYFENISLLTNIFNKVNTTETQYFNATNVKNLISKNNTTTMRLCSSNCT